MGELVEKLWKQGGPLVSLNETERSAVFTLSTGALDRDGETVDVEGIDLRDFQRNPIIALNHDTSSLPIGASWKQPGAPVEVWLDDVEIDGQHRRALLGKVYFSQANPQGQLAFSMLKEGTLNAASVSFLPTSRPEKNTAGGNHWGKSRLLEWSLTAVPSNPEALALAYRRLKGLNGETPMAKKEDEGPVAKGELDQENPPQDEPVIIEPNESAVEKQQPSEDIDPEKACTILRDGEVNGQPLTEEQRGMFGAACARANGAKGFQVCPSCAGNNGAAVAKALCPACTSTLRKSLGTAPAQGSAPPSPSAPPPEPPPPRFQDTVAEVVAILEDQQARLSKSEGAVSKHVTAELKKLLVEPVEQPLSADEEIQLAQAIQELQQNEARLNETLYRASGKRLF